MLHTNLFKTSFAFLSLSLSLGLLSSETFAQQCTPAPAGLVSWYAAENNALDSRSRNNGSLLSQVPPNPGPTFAAGQVGQAFNLDGVDDYVNIGHLPQLNNATELTVSAWVFRTADRPFGAIMGKFNTGGDATGNSFLLYLGGGNPGQNQGTLIVELDNSVNNSNLAIIQGTEIPLNTWTLITATWRNSDGQTAIYKNGVLESSVNRTLSIGRTMKVVTAYTAEIGAWGSVQVSPTQKFPGLIDEATLYNRALSASEIAALHAAGTAGKCKPTATIAPSGQVGWWTGDGNTDDVSGNNNNGSLNGNAFAVSRVGQGFDFNNETGITVPDNAAFNQQNFTIEAWVTAQVFTCPASCAQFIAAKSGSTGNSGYELGTNKNTGFLRLTFNGAAGGADLINSVSVNDGNFHHVVGSYDGATMKIFLDGVLSAQKALTTTVNYEANSPFVIGARQFQGSTLPYNGLIDEVSFYNRALTDAEITSIFNAGIAGKLKTTTTAAGSNVSTNVGSDATLTFSNVSAAGITQQIPLATAVLPALPAGFTHTGLTYDIATSASVSGNINLSFHLPSFTQSQFGFLKVLHLEGGVFVDRTVIQDFASRTLTAQVSSLSPFVIADGSTPTATDGTISGRILADNGNPVEGVTVRLSGSQSRLTITDAQGNYRFDNVETNGFYTVTPARVNYSFSPSQRSFSQLGNQTEAGFSATLNGDQQNPLDTTEYFVRQQYVDFLGREPEQDGLAYWSAQINHCDGNTACISRKRIEVSAAFFMSAEFQESASYVYDMYAATLGRTLNFSEFTTDRSQVVGGAGLDAAKTVFAQNFVGRSEFTARYPQSMTREQFVDALLETMSARSGVDHSSLRNQLLIDFDTSGRALVVRHASEASTFVAAEYNKAFVLIEYFGYLRRDLDQDGYGFWLNVLNNGAPNNYRGMVCSFLTSAEYQQRFSTVVTRSNASCSAAQ